MPLFIILVVLLGFAMAFAIAFPYIYQYQYSKKYHLLFAKKINRFSKKYDYCVVNNIVLKSTSGNRFSVDHLVFGDKNIFLIEDLYSTGDVYGKQIDNSLLISNPKTKSKNYIDNPFHSAEEKINELSKLLCLEKRLFIPIVAYNPTCNFVQVKECQQITNINQINKVFKLFESRNIAPLNEDHVLCAVNDLARMNLRDVK